MALGFLSAASGIVRGVTNFIKKRKAVKSEKLEKKAEKLADQKAKLSALGGDTFGLQDIIKLSASTQADKSKETRKGNTDTPKAAAALAAGGGGVSSIPVWLWPIAGIVILFVLLKGKK